MSAGLLSASEVAERAGVNYNTLLYWVRRGWLEAEVRPGLPWHPILFTAKQAKAAAAFAALKRRHKDEIRQATKAGASS